MTKVQSLFEESGPTVRKNLRTEACMRIYVLDCYVRVFHMLCMNILSGLLRNLVVFIDTLDNLFLFTYTELCTLNIV